MLSEDNDVTVYEKESRPGGMLKCDRIEGSLFHTTGGHVFNTKREDVKNWFWNNFDRENEFIAAERNATVSFGSKFIPYPIENHLSYFNEEIVGQIITDLAHILLESDSSYQNFEDFLIKRFGKTLYDLYFKPYNKKIWKTDLKNIPLSWLEGKLPMPTSLEIFKANIYKTKENKFVHSSFFYPKEDGSQFIINRIAQGLNILTDQKIESFNRSGDGKWIVNGEKFDRIIFTGNIKQIPALLATDVDLKGFSKEIESLEAHGTTSVFCRIDKNPYSWIYLPDSNHESHRIICTGNFSPTNNKIGEMTATIEFTDKMDTDEINKNLKKIPLNPQYITHNYAPFTYPIQNSKTREMISGLKKELKENGIFLCGRFAEWEYSNMDVCIGSAIDLKKILDNGSR